MKKLLPFLLLICSLQSFAQQTLTQINGWNAYVHLPANYVLYPTKYYPTIIFFPGTGEVGNNAAAVISNGPGAYITQGWNGNITLNGTLTEFIVISLQPSAVWQAEAVVDPRILTIKSTYRTSQIFLTGLSMGGWESSTYVSEGNYYKNISAIATYVGAIPTDNQPFPQGFTNFAKAGGKFLCVEQVNDGRYVKPAVDFMNTITPGSGFYQQTNYGDGGHDNWQYFYGGQGTKPQTLPVINMNVYEWFASLVKVPVIPNKPPTVTAGNPQTIMLPASATLNGIASDSDGTIASYKWTQLSGGAMSLSSTTTANTTASFTTAGTNVLRLTVTDNSGAASNSDITITVLPAKVIYRKYTVTDGTGKILCETLHYTDSTYTEKVYP